MSLFYLVDNLTANTSAGRYYNSETNDFRIPYLETSNGVFTGCRVQGIVVLKMEGRDAPIDSYAFDVAIDGSWHTDRDNKGLKILPLPYLAKGDWDTGLFYRVKIFYDSSEISYNPDEHTSHVGGYFMAYEREMTQIFATDTKKNLAFGQTNELDGSISVVYKDVGASTYSGNDKEEFLTAHGTMVSFGSVSKTYPNNFTVDENMYADTEQTVNYILSNGISFKQTIAVKYYKELILSSSASETGTPDSPLIVDENGLTISKTQFTANAVLHNNRYEEVPGVFGAKEFVSSTQTIDVTNDVIWSKDTFTKAEVHSYQAYNIDIAYQYNDDWHQTIRSLLTVFLEPKGPKELIINGTDNTEHYYNGEDSYFVVPTFTQDPTKNSLYSFIYNNNEEVEIDPSDIDTIEYYLSDLDSEQPLVDGSSIVPPAYNYLYIKIALLNGDSAYGKYRIYRQNDYVKQIICNPNFTFTLGNKLNKYKGTSIQVEAVWKNPAKENTQNFTDFAFDYSEIVKTDSDLGNSTNILIENSPFSPFSISLANVTYSYPQISSVVVKNQGNMRSSYQNNLDHIDLTEVILKTYYEDAEYTNELSFALDNVATQDTFGVKAYDTESGTQILNNVDYFDGDDAIDISGEKGIYYCSFNFQIYNEFTLVTEEKLVIPFNVTYLDEIKGLKIINPYRDYKVGEKFLNDNDTTIVRIFFDTVDSHGSIYTASSDVELKNDIPIISVNYAKGTEWTQPDSSKRIVVNSVYDSSISAEYTIQVTHDGYVDGSATNDLVVIWQASVLLPDGKTYTEDLGVLAIYEEKDTVVENEIRKLKSNLSYTPKPKGYIRNIFDTKVMKSQAVMVLFNDYTPPISGSPNIIINFPSYAGLADSINKCTFGILFGNNNANNRLFVSGNPDVSNADWHSGETNVIHSEGETENINGDFSYFPNENVMYYGETDNKVIGYDIVSNDKLLVLKDKSDKEKTVYFRTPTMVTALNATGVSSQDIQNNNLYQEEFALVKGNNSVAGVSPHSIINLNGDTLFIDYDKTLEGLDLTGIVGDNQRYANSRSIYLDNLLKDKDLSKSFLWTNNKYLFMPVKDEGIFVTHIKTFNEETRQYDWWLLQSENPTCFVEIDDVVYFGNEEGKLYRMRNGTYCDNYKVFVNEGQGIVAKINEEDYPVVIDGVEVPGESIVLNQELFNELFPEDNPYYDEDGNQIRKLYFNSINEDTSYMGSLFYQVASIKRNDDEQNVDLKVVEDDGVYYLEVVAMVNGSFDPERQKYLYGLLKENEEYYLNYYKEEGVQEIKCSSNSDCKFHTYGNKFRLVFVPSEGNDRYLCEYYNRATGQWESTNLGYLYKANLVRKVEGAYEICDVNTDSYSFKLKDDMGQLMNIACYGDQGQTNTFEAEIIEKKNVVAYYVTAPFTMGSVNYFKTMWSFTLTNDTGKASEYDLAIASNKVPVIDTKTIASISKAKIGTNFSDYTFKAVDFDKNVVPRTYTIQRTLGMQKFVCFAFKNSNDTNAILSSLSVIYTLPFPSYGSD